MKWKEISSSHFDATYAVVLYQGETLFLEDFLVVKSSVQKLGERRLRDQGLGERD